jgi:hypothetical protein
MSVEVLIETLPTGGYSATLLGWPDTSAEGATEEEALNRVRQLARERLQHSKVVTLDLATDTPPNPWLTFAAAFRDNPLLDDLDEAIAAHRRDLDAATQP